MRVASKIATGSGITVVLLFMVVAYDLSLVQRLAFEHRSISEINFRSSMISLEQSRLLNQLDEFTRKFFVTRDPAYAQRLGQLQSSFDRQLAELQGLKLSEDERRELSALTVSWNRYSRQFLALREAAPGEVETLRQEHLAGLGALRDQVDSLGRVARSVISAQVARSAEVHDRAQRISWSVAGLALMVSLIVLWLTIRSIEGPLQRLTQGTRAVADGEFSYRLANSSGDEFSSLASSFNEMVRRLAELDQMKKDFLSHVSHELKTPLVAIQETNWLLLEEIPGPLTDRQRRFLELNLDSCKRLSTMITRLLDLARMEAGVLEYDFARHDLVGLVETAAAELEVRARERDVSIRMVAPTQPLVAECDGDRLIQVAENLVDNALKYSPRDSVIEVRISNENDRRQAGEASVGSLLVEVEDRGPGVPEEDRDKIFERFHRAGNGQRGSSALGVGLGLTICREIVEAHRGSIWIERTSASGSTFSFRIPVEHRNVPVTRHARLSPESAQPGA